MKLIGRSQFAQIAWHALAMFGLACLPAIKWQAWWWDIPKRHLLPAALLIAAYGLSAALVVMLLHERGSRAAIKALAITLSVFSICLFGFLVLRLDAPRYLLLPIFAAAIVLIPFSTATSSLARASWGVCALAAAAAFGFTVRSVASHDPLRASVQRSYVKTAFYSLEVASHEKSIPVPATRGGGLDRLGDRVLLGTGDGHLYSLDLRSEKIEVETLPTIVPSNREEFANAFGGPARSPTRFIEWSEAGPPRVQTWRFRVADVIARPRGERVQLIASHHYWKAAEECFVLRVSAIEADARDLNASLRNASWHTLYDSTPCVPLKGEMRRRGKNPFKGEESGGRMALLDEDTLLLTIGDHSFYGLESLQVFAQDPSASYGKTVKIDLRTGSAEIFTSGHRNPQGLFAAPDGRIWLSEHGPQGGDEINLLSAGANYGWPIVTYGTDYGAMLWPLNAQQGRHDGFVQPIHAWVPSIGVSTLLQVEGRAFPIWRGDLLAGSLATRSLHRLVLDGDRVVVDEPIELGQRVRDVLELSDGRFLVWTDEAALITIAPASGTDGEALFAQWCLGCHQAIDGLSHRIGPDLYGIVGREVGKVSGYDEFSTALRAHSGTWTRERLDAFLRDPQAFAPGTTMAFAGIEDDGQRAKLIDYLETLDSR